ncbi:uncharacterized protein LOC101854218 [Aplysia californica]|uniref:Uncharacterized protein LOC101854218 n=1 Tax=Aplysia californica TaxID=6500 RepID=A0ABM1ADD5_APLCA|nr:uncharacterized protein LOC101854218 [Aplysia californica]
MACDMPCMSYMALYVISMHIVNSNSRSSSSSTHWKLNLSAGKVEQASAETDRTNGSEKVNNHSRSSEVSGHNNSSNSTGRLKGQKEDFEEKMMDILTNKVMSEGDWVVAPPQLDVNVIDVDPEYSVPNCDTSSKNCKEKDLKQRSKTSSESINTKSESTKKLKPLSCGKKVNATLYDHLRGVSERHLHSNIPEPDVAMVFKNSGKSSEVDMKELEQKLRKAKKDIEKAGPSQRQQAAQVYNLIGNFWRIKGNTNSAIECFRKALSILPEDPDILLNLARVLFNLQYLDDAIFLARRSLHLQAAGDNSWLQHYTLGEILKSYGHSQEAAMHFHQALELNPGFQPAKSHLRDLDTEPCPSVTHLTLFIILFLVVGVLFGVVTSIETNFQDSGSQDGSKLQQRHFNRAMAMRSIKLGINPRLCRLRRAANS